MNVTTVLNDLAEGKIEGHTHWFDGVTRDSGYVVGNGKKGVSFTPNSWMNDIGALSSYLEGIAIRWQSSEVFDGFGFWVDNGTLYVDPVVHINHKLEAVALGIAHGELAVYDLTTQSCINMSDYTVTEVSHVQR